MTTPFMYVKDTSFSEKIKNRLIFQLDVQVVASLLRMNANVLDMSLCILAVLRVPSISYYVPAFLLSVWHPKQQHRMNKWLEAAGDSFCHFFFFFSALFGVEWMFSMEMERYVWSLECLKKTKSPNNFVQLGEHWDGRVRKCVAFWKLQLHLLHS